MRRALWATALCVACFGCNAILGLDKYHVVSDAGGAAQCGSKLTPNANIVTSCVLLDSCSPFPIASISDCISLNVQQAFLGTACTANAKTCSDIELCNGYGFTSATQCPTGQTGSSCQGNVAVDCSNGIYTSCDKFGGQCTQVGGGAACRVLASCSQPDNTTSCQGDTAYTCLSGEGFGVVCTNVGAKCQIQNGQAVCQFAAPPCSGSVAPCDGQVAQACVNGQLQRYDCGSVGLTCDSEKGGPYCVAPGCKLANVTACQESCSGSVMHLCYGGAPYDVDCKNYGFSKCQQLDDTSQGGLGKYVTCSN